MKKIILFIVLSLSLSWTFLFFKKNKIYKIEDLKKIKEINVLKKETKEEVVNENELATHIVSTPSVESVKKENQSIIKLKKSSDYINVDGIELLDLTSYQPDPSHMYSEDSILANKYFCYYSFTRNNDLGKHYNKLYATYKKALDDAKVIHCTKPYNKYKSYTIEGLPQCGYKIYFVK